MIPMRYRVRVVRITRRTGVLIALVAGGLLTIVGSAVLATAQGGTTTEPTPTPKGLAAKVVASQAQCEAYTETPLNKTNGVSDERCLAQAAYSVMGTANDPATLLPKIDAIVRSKGGLLGSTCHLVMHLVGRRYGEDHGVTLDSLQQFLPRSNDPGCSAGFAHGLISTLGDAVATAAPEAAAICQQSPTREQRYTCIHGLGHAFMRTYLESISHALRGCDSLGARLAPDCGMGVFHDYWLSVSGVDETQRPANVELSPRKLCARQPLRFVRVCWYPAYLVRPPAVPIVDEAGADRQCNGLTGVQRFGCITAASVATSGDDARTDLASCRYFHGADVAACVRSVGAETLAKKPVSKQVAFVDGCTQFRTEGERSACFSWLARALTVATDGRFAREGCTRVAPEGRAACRNGARRWNEPLETFT